MLERTFSSCSKHALLQLKDVPIGLCSNDPALRPWERSDATGLLLVLSRPSIDSWCACSPMMSFSKLWTPAHSYLP